MRYALFLVFAGFLVVAAGNAAESPLSPGDLVKIEVFDNPDLSVTLRVPGEGTVVFPLIGELPPLPGITASALSREITTRLENGYLRQAQVTVAVLEYGVRQAFVMGSVGRPGSVKIAPGQSLSALQAISESGGFTDDASKSMTQLLREEPRTHIRAARLLAFSGGERDAAIDQLLQSGDVVIVPRADRIYIIGTVTRPGAVALPGNEPITVSKSISLAGGFERFAKQDRVQLLRRDQPTVTIDVAGILAGSKADDPVLQPGDTIFVPESRF